MNMNTKSGIASPDPVLQFLFSAFGILTWLSTLIKLPMDSALTLGIVQISLGIAAFTASIFALVKGDMHGNVNLALSVILGFSAGTTQIVSVWSQHAGFHFHPWIGSVMVLLGGIFLLCLLPAMTDFPVYEYLSHVFVAVGLVLMGIGGIASIAAVKLVGAWCLFFFGITGLYYGISLMWQGMGLHLPQGKTMKEVLGK